MELLDPVPNLLRPANYPKGKPRQGEAPVFSASTRRIDEGLKLERYSLLGVREYWTVDPTWNTVRVYRRSGDRLRQESELTAASGDLLTTPLLPGLEILLAEIFQ